MRIHLRTALLALLSVAPLAAQYNLVVTNLGDSASTGSGTLREGLLYLQANAPATATITLAVSGTLVLTSPLPYFNASTRLTIQHSFPSGRFTIDARPVSGGGPIHGIRFAGPDAIVTAPLTVLINNGIGLEFAGPNAAVEDVEIVGGSQFGFHAAATSNLVAKRVRVTGAGGIGIFANGCSNARFGDAASSGFAYVRDRAAPAIQIQGGSGVRCEAFDIALCSQGILATSTTSPVLGNASGPRSTLVDCTGIGVFFLNSIGSTGVRTLQRTDIARCSIGVQIDGGGTLTIAECVCDRNNARGVGADNGVANTLLDTVTCSNTGNGTGLGIYSGNVSSLRVKNCTLGPNNTNGLDAFGSGLNRGLVVEGGSAFENHGFGVRLEQIVGVVVDGMLVRDNIVAGVFVLNSPSFTLRNSVVRDNQGEGVTALNSATATYGPGNVVETNGSTGIALDGCDDNLVTDNPSISRNRFMGVYVLRCQRAVMRNSVYTANNALGASILSSNDCVFGPGNLVTGTTGTGIKFEHSRSGAIESSVIEKSVGSGVIFIAGTGTHLVRSTLVSRNRDVGINVRLSPPTDIVGCTVVGNYRGIYANGAYQSGTTQARVTSCILRAQTLDDYGTFDPLAVTLVRYSFVQNPPGTGTNSALDPLFAQEAAGDWRLQPTSPALDASEPALTWPGGALDAWRQPRVFGARADCGAWERQPSSDVLSFFPDAMPKPGAKVDFTLRWQTNQAGRASILLFNLAGPGVLPVFGVNVPLAVDQWLVTSLPFTAPVHVNTVVFGVPPTGTVNGSIDYGNGFLPILPAQFYPLRIWAAAFTLDLGTGLGGQVSNLSYFEIR